MVLRGTTILLTLVVWFPGVSTEQGDIKDHADDDVTLMQLYMNDARGFNTKMPANIEKAQGVQAKKTTETNVEPRFQARKLTPSQLAGVSTQYTSHHAVQGAKLESSKPVPSLYWNWHPVTPYQLAKAMQKLTSDAVVKAADTTGGGIMLAACVLAPVLIIVSMILITPCSNGHDSNGKPAFQLSWYHYILFVAISMLGPMATDIILPAFPEIAASLNASDYLTSLTMPVNMGVRGLSMVVIGSLSDKFGQKKMMLVSLVLFTGGSIVCMKCSNIETMLVGRVMQGSGEASDALVQAVVRMLVDEPHSRMRVLSVLQSLQPVFVIIAPLVGSVLTTYYGWRSIYCFLMTCALVSLMGYILIVPETRDESPKQPLLQQFSIALCTRESWPFLVPCALIFVVLLSMLCNSAFVLEEFGASTIDKGLLIATMPPFVAIGAFVTGNVFQREGLSLFITLRRAMGFVGLLLICTFSIGIVFEHSQWLIMAAFWSITFSVGMCLPTLCTLYLEPLKDSCGLAGGILVGTQNISAALLVPFSASMLDRHGIRSMFLVFMTIHLVGQTVFWLGFGLNYESYLPKDDDKADGQESVGAASLLPSKS